MFREEWRQVEGYEGRYEISDIGRVLSLSRPTQFGKRLKITKRKFLKPMINTNGYVAFDLNDAGSGRARKMVCAHRLIANAFNLPSAGATVNHIDGNKLNNWIGNLELCSLRENIQHAAKLGLMPRGSAAARSILGEADVILIRFWKRIGLHREAICAKFAGKFKQSTINSIFYNANWAWFQPRMGQP